MASYRLVHGCGRYWQGRPETPVPFVLFRFPRHPGLAALALPAVLVLPLAAWAAGIAHDPRPDPLLDGVRDGPCAGLTGGPDYVPGTDAEGYPAMPADVGAGPVGLPDQVVVPLRGPGAGHHFRQGRHGHGQATGGTGMDGPFAVIDGRRLAPLLQAPACGQAPPAPPR